MTHHGSKGYSSWSVVIDGNEVNEEGSSTHHCWNKEGSNEHLLYPSPSCKKGHSSGTGEIRCILFKKLSASSPEFMYLTTSPPQKVKELWNNILHRYKSQESTNSFIWLLATHKMQHINPFIRPGVKTGKGIQRENISAEEQHMLTKLAKETREWNLSVYASCRLVETEIAELALCRACSHPESTSELSAAPGTTQHYSCFQVAPAPGCLDLAKLTPYIQDALRNWLSLV